MGSFRYIKDIIWRNRFRYVSGIICLIIVDILQLVLPKILGTLTDLLKAGTLSRNLLAVYAGIIILIAVGVALFRFFWRYLILGASRIIELDLRNRFYFHLQSLDADYYNNHKTGDLMAHATNDIGNITTAAGHGVIIAIDSALIPVVAVIMMMNSGGIRLTLASFLPLVILGILMIFFLTRMPIRIQKMQEAFSQLTETARENFSGIRVVKSFVQEAKEAIKFEKANQHNRQMNIRYVRLMSMLFPTIMSVAALSFAVALWYGGILVILGNITLGDFVAFNSYLGMLVWPIAALGWVASMFQKGSVSLKRVNRIMDEKPQVADPAKPEYVNEIKGRIRFSNLTFSYPGNENPVLKNIDITIEQGKTLAVVGKTGSGKTTLISLIARLFNAPDGTLFIDDVDINRISLAVLREALGFVPQETFLFSTTIRENIDFFLNKSDEEIFDAAKTAKIYDNITEFPDSFNTMVGERGITLSGGQKQRLAIARAILRTPAILILDDCLSAVDAGTEEEILRDLKKVMRKRTSIIVSHRISAIMDADEIIMLEDGRIIERGTHKSLIDMQGAYFNLYQKQLLAERIEGEE